MTDIPPPPPGFEVDNAATPPPPPPGFQLDAAKPPVKHGPIDKLLGLGTERYQTWPERAVRDVIGLPKRAIEAAASGPPGSRGVTERSVPVAADIAMAATPTGVASRAAKGALTAGKGVAAPTAERLFESADTRYGTLRADPLKLTQDVLAGLRDNIKDALIEDGFRDYEHGSVFKVVDEIVEPVGRGTPGDIQAVRSALSRMRKNSNLAGAANTAIEKIDDYLSNIPDVAETARAARGDYRAAKNAETFEREVLERGSDNAKTSGLGGNLPNTLRQRLKAVIYNKQTRKYLTDEEIDGMREALDRNTFDFLIESMARLGPKHPLVGWGTAAIADLSHGMGAATASLGLGALAQKLADYRMTTKLERLDEGMRAKSPLGKEMGSTGPQKTSVKERGMDFLERYPQFGQTTTQSILKQIPEAQQ